MSGLISALALLAQGATANPVALQDEAPVTAELASTSGRSYAMEMNFRLRKMSVPDTLMDIPFYSSEETALNYERPKIQGYAMGLEFVTKKDSANGIFYFEFADSLMKEGYWDDREGESDANHQDGEWIIPSKNLGLLTFGANYAYEAFFVRTEQTHGNFGLSFVVGGGLGVGFLVGDVYYIAQGDDFTPAYQRAAQGDEPDGLKPGVIPVVPMVDMNAGLRFNFGDRAVLRLEGGMHTMLYYGATMGIMF
ncbi:MAG: hypothetical protein JXX28_10855 [Deltaproteobacteria bacterium]|nr:hypothetical protein [Deltaproteobacteria bacterium]